MSVFVPAVRPRISVKLRSTSGNSSNRGPTNNPPQSAVLGLKERRCGANRDLFLCAAERELNLQPVHLGNLNLNTIQDERLDFCSMMP
jgi:hypothetical protein